MKKPPEMKLVIEIPSAKKPYRRIELPPEHPLVILTALDEQIIVTVKDYLKQSRVWESVQ